ncbi:uncharacterized protein [Henckelia pumila]|uniref:uncharacterized protein n=1 Tax=Henckelia pumila TaxID=405737 RepID=UPI003C6DDEDF
MSSIRNPLSAILEKHVLTGPNYLDWLRNLKIVLNSERFTYTLDKSSPDEAPTGCSFDELQTYKDWYDHDLKAKCYMLASMSDKLQRRFEDAKNTADIHLHIKELFGDQTRPLRHGHCKRSYKEYLDHNGSEKGDGKK